MPPIIRCRKNKIFVRTVARKRKGAFNNIGYNHRMSNFIAIGLAQFENLSKFVKRKIEIAHLH